MSWFAAVMKKEAGGQHPASHYLVVEDPAKSTTWHLRVYDAAGKLDHTLMGDAWQALHEGFRGNPYTGPDKAKALSKLVALYKREGMDTPDAKMSSSAGFALGAAVRRENGYVIRHGKLFEGGDYPDKDISFTPEELAHAVASFSPVPVDLEHTSTPLDGRMGEVRSVEVGPDGWTLFGDVALPEWLDAALEGTGRKVSAMWDRGTKLLSGLALVNYPRISDAALMAAFAGAAGTASGRHDTYDGQRTMQAIHDMAAKSGALCSQDNPNGTQQYSSSYFVSSHERTGMQAVHDTAIGHGAKCSAMGKTSTYAAAMSVLFAGQRHSAGDAKDIQAIHDLATKQGADCAPGTAEMTAGTPVRTAQAAGVGTGGRRGMSLLNNFKTWFAAGREMREVARSAGAEVPDEALFRTVEDEAYEARATAQREEVAKLEQERSALTRERDTARQETIRAHAMRQQSEAAAFADGLVAGHKLFPAERESLIAAFVTAAQDDAAHGGVTFASGAQGSRIDQLKAIYEARPAHSLTKEHLDPRAKFQVLPPNGDPGQGTSDLEAPTEDGQQLSAGRKSRLIKFTGIDPKAAQKA